MIEKNIEKIDTRKNNKVRIRTLKEIREDMKKTSAQLIKNQDINKAIIRNLAHEAAVDYCLKHKFDYNYVNEIEKKLIKR